MTIMMMVLINELVDSVLLRDNGVRQDRSFKERMQVAARVIVVRESFVCQQ